MNRAPVFAAAAPLISMERIGVALGVRRQARWAVRSAVWCDVMNPGPAFSARLQQVYKNGETRTPRPRKTTRPPFPHPAEAHSDNKGFLLMVSGIFLPVNYTPPCSDSPEPNLITGRYICCPRPALQHDRYYLGSKLSQYTSAKSYRIHQSSNQTAAVSKDCAAGLVLASHVGVAVDADHVG